MSERKVDFDTNWEPEPVEWIWPGWLARGKVTILAGNAGTGKSTLTQAIAAIVTAGGVWPDSPEGSPQRAEQGYFMGWDGEDDLNDTTGPRFIACGGNRKFYLPLIAKENGEKAPFNPRDDIDGLKEAARKYGDKLAVLSISPLVALRQAAGQDENSNVRRDMEALVNLAAELNIAVIGVHHLTKGTKGNAPLERLTGSLAYGAISRATMIAVMGEDQSKARLVRVKNSLGIAGGGIDYTIEGKEITNDRGEKIATSRIKWGKFVSGSAISLIDEIDGGGRAGARDTETKRAEDFLDDVLSGGPIPRPKVVEMGQGETPPIAARTLDRAAGNRGIKAGPGGWQKKPVLVPAAE